MKSLICGVALIFAAGFIAVPAYGEMTTTTWKYSKKSKTWRVSTRKLKSTFEVIKDLQKPKKGKYRIRKTKKR